MSNPTVCVNQISDDFKEQFSKPLPDELRQLAVAACIWFKNTDLAFEMIVKAYKDKLLLEELRKELGDLSELEDGIVANLIAVGKSVEEIKKAIENKRSERTKKKNTSHASKPKAPGKN